ncbi:MAG: C-terminal binding protein [Dehalococcoidia bacterium]
MADYIRDELSPERGVLEGEAIVEALDAADEREFVAGAQDAVAVMLWHVVRLTREGLSELPACRLIVRMGVGVDNVDIAAAEDLGIGVANVPDYGTEDVADSAIGLMLALARGIALLNSRLRAGLDPWSHVPAAPLHRLRGRTLALAGMSRIGTATALRARALGMDVVFFDPFVPAGYEKAIGVRRVESLEALLAEAHVLSLHCPLNEHTRHMIDAAAIARMPRGALLINTARGGLIDTAALPEAIRSGQLAGAGLDVLPVEPPPDDDPLIRAWRDPEHPAHYCVIINPHASFYCEQSIHELRTKAAETCRRALHGLPISTLVNHPKPRPQAQNKVRS